MKRKWAKSWDWHRAKAANDLAFNMARFGHSVQAIVDQIHENTWLPEKAAWACAYKAHEDVAEYLAGKELMNNLTVDMGTIIRDNGVMTNKELT